MNFTLYANHGCVAALEVMVCLNVHYTLYILFFVLFKHNMHQPEKKRQNSFLTIVI